MASVAMVLDSTRQAAIRVEARFAALRALKATFKAWSVETAKSQKDLAEILHCDPAHVSRVLAGDKRSMTIETLFLFARAMGRRPRFEMEPLNALAAHKPNYDARPDFVRTNRVKIIPRAIAETAGRPVSTRPNYTGTTTAGASWAVA